MRTFLVIVIATWAFLAVPFDIWFRIVAREEPLGWLDYLAFAIYLWFYYINIENFHKGIAAEQDPLYDLHKEITKLSESKRYSIDPEELVLAVAVGCVEAVMDKNGSNAGVAEGRDAKLIYCNKNKCNISTSQS
jgi:hypothetical protein